MAKRMTKKEYNSWRAQHAGKEQFEIFHKEGGAEIVDFTFWAKSRDEAVEELELFKQKQQLVSPSSETEYFYRDINKHVVVQEDGTYVVGSSLEETMFADFGRESLWEKICGFFSRISWKMRDVKYMLFDMAFYLGHYSMRLNRGEDRADSWNIDATVTRKILFNVPRMIKSLHGCPSCYVTEAVIKTRAAKGQTITPEQAYRMQSTEEEMDMAVAEWKKDLKRLVLYIRLYEYYSASGIIGPEDGSEMAKIDKKFKSTLPVMPGTDGELDHLECEKLADKYWNLYCDHWKKIGRICWD